MSIRLKLAAYLLGGVEAKESQARIISSQSVLANPVQTPANYEGLARQGYSTNSAVYACVAKISQACSGIQWGVFRARKGGKAQRIEEHPLVDLLERPNPMQGQQSFFEAVVGFHKITGNSYIELVRPTKSGPPTELWPMRPDRVTIQPAANGYPRAYIFKDGQSSRVFPVDFVTMKGDVVHLKSFNPLNDWYGMSPLQAALLALDQNNSGQRYNLALLQNQATPSGILKVLSTPQNPKGSLPKDVKEELIEKFQERHAGIRNAGRMMLLEGGLDWQQLSLSPRELDFLKGKEITAGDIALVYGVPGELVGFGQKTFNNYKEARLAFYEDTILPEMDFIRDELNRSVAPLFGADIYIDYIQDDVEALVYRREQKYATAKDADFLKFNEKRAMVGLEPVEGGDVFIIGGQAYERPDEVAPANSFDVISPNEDSDEDGKSDDPSEFKIFNPINISERRKSWKAQNLKRKGLTESMRLDMAEDLNELADKVGKAVHGIQDPRLASLEAEETIAKFSPILAKTLARHIEKTTRSFGDLVLVQGKAAFPGMYESKANTRFDSFVESFVRTRTANDVKEILGVSTKQMKKIIRDLVSESVAEGTSLPDLTAELTSRMKTLTPARARTIARTEVAVASNNGSREAVKSLQIPNMGKEWVSANDDRVRDDPEHADHSIMNGARVLLDEKFGVPPDATMDGPGDSSADPSQVCNCRCVLVYGVVSNNNQQE